MTRFKPFLFLWSKCCYRREDVTQLISVFKTFMLNKATIPPILSFVHAVVNVINDTSLYLLFFCFPGRIGSFSGLSKRNEA